MAMQEVYILNCLFPTRHYCPTTDKLSNMCITISTFFLLMHVSKNMLLTWTCWTLLWTCCMKNIPLTIKTWWPIGGDMEKDLLTKLKTPHVDLEFYGCPKSNELLCRGAETILDCGHQMHAHTHCPKLECFWPIIKNMMTNHPWFFYFVPFVRKSKEPSHQMCVWLCHCSKK